MNLHYITNVILWGKQLNWEVSKTHDIKLYTKGAQRFDDWK